MTVFSAQAGDDRTIYVGGIADAVAYQPTGAIDLVIDWKTDVSPTPQQIDLYREQMRDYLVATGAPDGLLVFVTTGQLIRVRPAILSWSRTTRAISGVSTRPSHCTPGSSS
jgi:exodeoxyribonuclease-5